MKEIIKLPPEHYLNLIKENKPFSFARFGDGEVLCMFHDDNIKVNCDGSEFLDSLTEPMKQVFRNQYNYYHCLLDCSFDHNGDKFRFFLSNVCPEMPFYYGEIWSELSGDLRIMELVDALAPHHPVFVGGQHLENISFMYGFLGVFHIEIPGVDSFLEFNRIKNQIMEYYEAGHRMFCFSAGYTTKILIDTLFPVIGHDAFLLDMGSVFDPYCGILSRRDMVANGFKKFQPFTRMKLA